MLRSTVNIRDVAQAVTLVAQEQKFNKGNDPSLKASENFWGFGRFFVHSYAHL